MLGIALLLGLVALWALLARRLESLGITMAVGIVIAAILLTSGRDPVIRIALDTHVTEQVVEVMLAVLLFVDANDVPASIIVRERKVLTRLLVIAFPLSLIAAWAAGLLVFSSQSAWLLAVLAVIVAPLDLAPTPSLVRERRIPRRLRDLLNLESGFNDGLVAPVFLFAIAAASAHGKPGVSALVQAIPAIAVAAGIGAPIGILGAVALSWSWRRGWTQAGALRVGVLVLPLLTYVLAVNFGGNGFVAAFVAGVVFAVCRRELPVESLQLTEDTLVLLSLVIWFLFGDSVRQVFSAGVSLDVILYAVLALAVVRTVPVVLSLRGTDVPGMHALFLGLMGPRGLASLVFGLLATIELGGSESALAEQVMVVTVLLSLVLHGASVVPVAAGFARSRYRSSETFEGLRTPGPKTRSVSGRFE